MALIGDATAASVGAAGSQSATSKAKLDDDLNKFLNLLVTQIKYQDPLDPMDATEFTSQLVQFASVEQQIFQSSLLEKQLDLQENNQVSNLVDFIGRTIEATGKTVPLENGKAEFAYDMPKGARKGAIVITNNNGTTVFNGEIDLTEGRHAFTWDGKDKNGNVQPDGAYNVLTSASDSEGNLLDVPQSIFGRVTGVSVQNGDVVLFMGDDISITQNRLLSVKETVVP